MQILYWRKFISFGLLRPADGVIKLIPFRLFSFFTWDYHSLGSDQLLGLAIALESLADCQVFAYRAILVSLWYRGLLKLRVYCARSPPAANTACRGVVKPCPMHKIQVHVLSYGYYVSA